MIIADVVIKSARLGSLLCPSASSVIPPACTWTHIHMRTLTTVTNSSLIDGRHSQDTDSLTSDFILYLPPALLTLLSWAKLWALVQGLQSVGRQAVRTAAQTFSVTAFTVESLLPQGIQLGSHSINSVLGCANAPMPHSHVGLHWSVGENHVAI